MSAFPSYGSLTESRCSQCNYKLDAATKMHGEEGGPEQGNVSLCFNCGQISMYQSDLTLRKASAAEIRGLMEEKELWATIEKAQMFIQRRGRFR